MFDSAQSILSIRGSGSGAAQRLKGAAVDVLCKCTHRFVNTVVSVERPEDDLEQI
jgi:hypothetical protein